MNSSARRGLQGTRARRPRTKGTSHFATSPLFKHPSSSPRFNAPHRRRPSNVKKVLANVLAHLHTSFSLRLGLPPIMVLMDTNQTPDPKPTSKPARKPRAAKLTPAQYAVKHKLTVMRHGKRVPDQWKVRRVARSLGYGVGRGGSYSLTAAQQKALSKALSK